MYKICTAEQMFCEWSLCTNNVFANPFPRAESLLCVHLKGFSFMFSFCCWPLEKFLSPQNTLCPVVAIAGRHICIRALDLWLYNTYIFYSEKPPCILLFATYQVIIIRSHSYCKYILSGHCISVGGMSQQYTRGWVI